MISALSGVETFLLGENSGMAHLVLWFYKILSKSC
jgi:hypothetical protein